MKKQGVFLSPGGVGNIWLRHNIETFNKRLLMSEEKMARENFILTEAQLVAMERRKETKDLAEDKMLGYNLAINS